ncbi:Retrovirus-related Pol polyprotein from transposon RE2 [Sesamum angolense]|uniref:Retrovirus-related Pol polyprotein from transposon RE2 n=1 Tax=Sesamum angolense TaxID=2727404 RepID=A0AAE2BHM2_9LAMI|nr:Retrovirus-related Pol polyprotein from transposon RE2 [Sesamum angolense]
MIDSGATSHLTGNRSHFLTLSTSPKFLPVRLADGSYSPISGSGTVQPTANLTLTNVLFAPKFPVNLLSVSQLTKTHNCSVTFYPSYCVIQDQQTRRTIGSGHERGGLYFLDTTPPVDARALFASVSPLQWHSRLVGILRILVFSFFPNKPLFGIAPRVFGCVCFVHIHSPSLDKLSPRSVKCIFLGYSRTQKGYQCYDPQSRRSFASADVTFFEFTPFYSPQSSVVIPPPSVPLPIPTLFVPPHTEPPTRPLQVYSRRNRSTNTTLTGPPDLPPTAAPGNPSATPANDLPIALRKAWKMAMDDEMSAHGGHGSLWSRIIGEFNETVYMEQPPGYVAQGEKQRMVCKLKKLFMVLNKVLEYGMVVLAVYVDDILITGSDIDGIEKAKTYLQKPFVTKDLGRPRYFLGIEIAHSKHGVSLSHRKYTCDLLQEAGFLGTKPVDTPMDSNPDFWNDDGNYLEDKTKYRRLVGKLIYLTVTRPDISFAVGLRHGHVKIEAYSDADYAGSKDDRKSTSGYCTYVGGNLVTWRSKKQTTVARSSAETEYRAMAHFTSEILWLKNLLKELGFMYDDPVPMHCDNQAAIHIVNNPIFHERTKHIEVDCHFVREAIMSQKICTPFTPSSEQRADIFTKALGSKQFNFLSNKLGMIDIFAPA